MRPWACAVMFVMLTGAVLAAPTYTVPPHPAVNPPLTPAATNHDNGFPKTTWNGGKTALTIQVDGKYNYDDAYTFGKLQVYITSIKGGQQGVEIANQSYTTEAGMATKGSVSVTFSNVAPPAQGYHYVSTIRLSVTKTGAQPPDGSHAKQVTIPP